MAFFDMGAISGRETTYRGTLVGDSPEKIAALFEGVECAVLDSTQPEEGEELTYIYTDFAAYLGGEEIDRGNVGLTYAYYIVEGRPLGLEAFRTYAAAGESLEDVEGYTLTYLFYRGKVESIFLDYERLGSMIEEDPVAE